MINTHCNYRLFNEDTYDSLEEGNYISEFSYWDDGHKITLEKIYIKNIRKDKVTLLTTDDWCGITISINDIEGWN
jgi:hypothetical protein